MGLIVNLLGPFQVFSGENPETPILWPRKQTKQLFKILISQRGSIFSQDQLIELLFSDLPVDRASNNLHKRISELRKTLEPDRIRGEQSRYVQSPSQGNYSFIADAPCVIDMEEFSIAIKTGESAKHDERWRDAIVAFENALSLYAGDYLEEDLYEEWAQNPRQGLKQDCAIAYSCSAISLIHLGQYEKAAAICQQALEHMPTQEDFYFHKMRSHAYRCETQQALATYERCVIVLKEELGVSPSPEIQELYHQIWQGKITKPRPDVPNNIPEPLTRFVGRESEQKEIQKRLTSQDCRLLTLSGPGGIGKTRLALQVAIEGLGTTKDGVFWIELAAVHNEKEIVFAIGSSMSFRFSGKDEPKSQLLEFLKEKELLLSLDNFEQLTNYASLVSDLLANCPKIKCIITSREPLGLLGENLIELRGLSIPPIAEDEALHQYGASSLFIESSLRLDSNFAQFEPFAPAITQICRLVDGHPLAIEMAGSWTRLMTPDRIADEIERNINFLATRSANVPERHRSIRAVFTSTWDRLSAIEREGFMKLSLFRGGFVEDAAGTVAEVSLDQLTALLERSLLIHSRSKDRFEIHELLRQFGIEELEASGLSDKFRARHLSYYIKLAESSENELRGPNHTDWIDRLERERGNFNNALDWALSNSNPGGGVQLASSLALFWEIHGLYSEGRTWLERAISIDADIPEKLAAKTFRWAGMIAARQADFEPCKAHLNEAIAIYEKTNDGDGLARALYILGAVHREFSLHNEAKAYLKQSLELYEELGDIRGIGDACNVLAIVYRDARKYEVAEQLYSRSLKLFREFGEKDRIASGLQNLGYLKHKLGETALAIEMLEESIEISLETGNRAKLVRTYGDLGNILSNYGKYDKARIALVKSVELGEEVGLMYSLMLAHLNLGWLDYEEGNLEDSIQQIETGLAIADRLENHNYVAWFQAQWALIDCERSDFSNARNRLQISYECYDGGDPGFNILQLLGISRVYIAEGECFLATQLLAAIESRAAHVKSYAATVRERYLHVVRKELSKQDYQEALQQGGNLEIKDAMRLAFGE
jgi:predicted ATPase/DNA-binding SARP family transcriptional activator